MGVLPKRPEKILLTCFAFTSLVFVSLGQAQEGATPTSAVSSPGGTQSSSASSSVNSSSGESAMQAGREDAGEQDIFVVCQREKEMRWIRAFRTDSGSRCRALYSKDGFAQSVSSGQNFNSCKSVLENIRKNIEEGGFKCRDGNLTSLVEIDL